MYEDFINVYIKYKLIELFAWKFFYYGENCVELPWSYRIFCALSLESIKREIKVILYTISDNDNFVLYDLKSFKLYI